MIRTLIMSFIMFLGVAAVLPTQFVSAAASDDLVAACAQARANGGALPAYCEGLASSEDPVTGTDGIIYKVTDILSIAAGAIAVIIIIIAGLRFVIAGGEPGKIASARSTILYALVGLVVVVMSNAIIKFVLSKI